MDMVFLCGACVHTRNTPTKNNNTITPFKIHAKYGNVAGDQFLDCFLSITPGARVAVAKHHTGELAIRRGDYIGFEMAALELFATLVDLERGKGGVEGVVVLATCASTMRTSSKSSR